MPRTRVGGAASVAVPVSGYTDPRVAPRLSPVRGHALAHAISAAPTIASPAFRAPAGVAPTPTRVPRLRLLVANAITGRVGWELPFSALSWNAPLNGIGQHSATVPIEATLDALDAQGANDPRNTLREVLLGPGKFCLVVCYGNTAVVGGPLQSADEDVTSVKVGASGLEKFLEVRQLASQSAGSDLTSADRDLVLYNMTPGGAAYHVVNRAITTFQAGRDRSLPITSRVIPDMRGYETFTYLSYDLTAAWKALGDLSARVGDGPDVRLEPFLSERDDGFYVEWDLQIGSPTFDQAPGVLGLDKPLPWTWDDTTSRITRSTDPAGMATDYYVAGSGQDRDKRIVRSSSDFLTGLGFPVMERVDTGSASSLDTDILQRRADAQQDAHNLPTDSWKLTVPIDGDPPLGTYRRGDIARIEVRRKLLIPAGDYPRRITEIAGDATGFVTVTCDYEDALSNTGGGD